MLSSSKISLWEGHFLGGVRPPRTPEFGPNNCLTNNFLHYEFQLSMLSSSKFFLWEGYFFWEGGEGAGGSLSPPRTPKFGPNSCFTNDFLQRVLIFHFVCWAVQSATRLLAHATESLARASKSLAHAIKSLAHASNLWHVAFCH